MSFAGLGVGASITFLRVTSFDAELTTVSKAIVVWGKVVVGDPLAVSPMTRVLRRLSAAKGRQRVSFHAIDAVIDGEGFLLHHNTGHTY